MLDIFIKGEYEKIGEEGMPVIKQNSIKYELGAAANVANNIKTLGEEVVLFGGVGNDEAGRRIKNLLTEKNIRYKLKTIDKTTTKMRINNLFRVDDELKLQDVKYNINEIKKLNPEIIIISDYAKGAVTQKLCDEISKLNAKILVDPMFCDYSNVYLIKPNWVETKLITGEEDLSSAINKLKEKYKRILVTKSKEGMTIYEGGKEQHFPTKAKEVYDVTGAGDMVLSVIAVCLVRGYSLEKSIKLGNKAAGIVVGHHGQYQVKWKELQ